MICFRLPPKQISSMRTHSFVFGLVLLALFVVPAVSHAATDKNISTVDTPGSAGDVIVAENYAYVADPSAGITVVNVSNTASPAIGTSIALPDVATHVDISGNILYVADTSSVKIFSLANRAVPALLGTYSQSGLAVTDVVADGSHLYVLGTVSGAPTLEVLDVSNSAAPTLAGSVAVHGTRALSISGTAVYVVGGAQLDVVSTSSYPTLTVLGTYTDALSSSTFTGVGVFGSVAYINDATNGFHAISIATPASMSQTFNTTAGTGYGNGIAISNGYVFLPITSGGLAIYDFASTGSPVYVDTLSTAAGASAVTIANDVAYVAVGTTGIQLLNVSQPDTIPPSVTPVGDSTPVIIPGGKYVDPGVTVTDNVGGTGTTVTGKVDTSKVGKYTLTYTVTDRGGNVTTVKRTVIVGPLVEKLTLKNNTYTLKVGKKNAALKPFNGYRGAIVGRKITVSTKADPLYVFIATDAMKNPQLVIYNASGIVVTSQNLSSISTQGLQVEIASNPATLSVFYAIAPKANGLVAAIFNISKSGFKSLKMVTAAKGRGTLLMKWIQGYTNEYVLATLVKGKPDKPLVWRYNGLKKSFVRDTKFDTALLSWTTTSVMLK